MSIAGREANGIFFTDAILPLQLLLLPPPLRPPK